MALVIASSDRLDHARDLHRAAVREYRGGHPATARRILRRALHTLKDITDDPSADSARGRVWLTLAACDAELDGPRAALAALSEAESAAARAQDDVIAVLIWAQRGQILGRAGDTNTALKVLEQAAQRRHLLAPHDQCNLLLSLSTIRLMRGELRRPRAELTEAIALARRAGSVLDEFKARHNLGYLQFLSGDLPGALRQMDEALSLSGDLPRGVSLLDRARILAEAGLRREADESLAEAEELFRAARLEQDVAEAELSRAEVALVGGDIATARRFAARARSRFRRRQSMRWLRHAELIVLYTDFLQGKRSGRMLATALTLADQLAADGHHSASRMAALFAVELRLATGDVSGARLARVAASAARTRVGDPIAVRSQARYVQAAAAYQAGDLPAARRCARTGLAELDRYRARFGSIDLQTAAAVHGLRLAEIDLSIALQSGRPNAVLAAGERARAVSSRLPTVRPPADARTAALLGELRQVVEQVRTVELDREAAEPLQHVRRKLEREIAAQAWTASADGAVTRPVQLSELRSELTARDTVCVYYVVAGRQLYAVVSGATGSRLQPLGALRGLNELVRRARADLDAAAQPFVPGPVREAVSGSLARTLRELDERLLRPLRLPDRRLLIVPTRSLPIVPWTLLPSTRAVPIEVAPSATVWRHAASPNPRAAMPFRLTALAGGGLRRADAEVNTIAELWPGAVRLLCRDAATCPATTDAITSSTVVHIAAHGRHSAENPLFSSLRLADGPMFAYELESVGTLAEHVVLSACELGVATIRPGDEPLGLTSVLLHLGSRSVISGVAAVADDAACDAMVRYHSRLVAGRDSAEALADVLAETADAAPVPFVCFGASWRLAS